MQQSPQYLGTPQYMNGWFSNMVDSVYYTFVPGAAGEELNTTEAGIVNAQQESANFLAQERLNALNTLNNLQAQARSEQFVNALLASLASIEYARTQRTDATDQYWSLEGTLLTASPLELYQMLYNLEGIVKDPLAVTYLENMRRDYYNTMDSMSKSERGGMMPTTLNTWIKGHQTELILGAAVVSIVGGIIWWRTR